MTHRLRLMIVLAGLASGALSAGALHRLPAPPVPPALAGTGPLIQV